MGYKLLSFVDSYIFEFLFSVGFFDFFFFFKGNSNKSIHVLSSLFNRSDSPNHFSSVVNENDIPLYKLTTYK